MLYSVVFRASTVTETRATQATAQFGLRVSGRELELVQDGEAIQTMPLRRYSDITKGAWLACDADAAPGTLSGANIRLLGSAAADAQIIAAFYDSAGRMRAAQVTSAAEPSFHAPSGSCAEIRLFAVSAAGAPLTAKLLLPQ